MLLSEIAQQVGLVHTGPDLEITGLSTLESAGKTELSFLVKPQFAALLATTQAGAVLCTEEFASQVSSALISRNVPQDRSKIGALFVRSQGNFSGISELACIDESAVLGENVTVYPFAFIAGDTHIGDGCTIFPGCYIGERCSLGTQCTLYPNVSIMSDCFLGDRVIIHAGTVLGADGFGYAQEPTGHMKIPQIGRVEIGDDVEIGANSCVDRASLDVTRIGRGTKIDNQVQIAHNVILGEHCLAAAQVGIAGSVRMGDAVFMGGGAAFKDNIEVGARSMIGARTGVTNSIQPGAKVAGSPHLDLNSFLRVSAGLPRLPDALKRLRKLEKQVQQIAHELAGEDNV